MNIFQFDHDRALAGQGIDELDQGMPGAAAGFLHIAQDIPDPHTAGDIHPAQIGDKMRGFVIFAYQPRDAGFKFAQGSSRGLIVLYLETK